MLPGLVALGRLDAPAMLGSQLAFMAGQFRGWSAARQADDRYRGWLTDLSCQVPRGECVIMFNDTDAIYSNPSVYWN